MMGTRSTPSDAPKPREYTIREGDSAEDMFYLRWQWEHYFGTDLEDETHLPGPLADVMGWIDEDDGPLAVCTPIAEHEGVPIGGGVAVLDDHETTVEQMPSMAYFDRGQLAGQRNAWLNLGVVDPAWRGHGIGRDLFRYRLRWARAQGVDMVFAYGWDRDDGRSSRPLFEGHGFTPVQQFADYYATEGDRDSCPDCGIWASDDAVCECATTFWALDGSDLDV